MSTFTCDPEKKIEWMIFEYIKHNLFITSSMEKPLFRGGSSDQKLEVYLHNPEGEPVLIAGAKI